MNQKLAKTAREVVRINRLTQICFISILFAPFMFYFDQFDGHNLYRPTHRISAINSLLQVGIDKISTQVFFSSVYSNNVTTMRFLPDRR